MKINNRKRQARGQVLIMTAFLIFVLFTLALSFFKLVPTELNSALRTKQAISAQVFAESGLKEARVWLESQPPQKVLTQAVLNNEFNAGAENNPIGFGDTFDEDAPDTEAQGRWRYAVRLETNPTGPYAFDVISTCFFEDQPLRQVRATIARENFSRYALFIDRWQDDLFMEANSGAIQGPFHTNDFFKIVVPDNFYDANAEPFVGGVNGVMTHAGTTDEGSLPFVAQNGDGNAYYGFSSTSANGSEAVVPYDANGAIQSRYEALVEGGRSNLSVTEHVSLPYSADELMAQALGLSDVSGAGTSTDIGLYVPTNPAGNEVKGGIVIVGDVAMGLSLDANGNQVHEFTQAIPEEAYRYETQEQFTRDVFGNVDRTLDVGSTYYVSNTVTQSVGVQQIVGYETQVREVTRQRQVGQQWVGGGGGGGTTVGGWQPVYESYVERTEIQVPIYDTVQEDRQTVVRTAVTITDPNDPMVGSTVSSYEKIGEETDTRTVPVIVSSEEYEANPGAYPDATMFLRPGPPKTAKVTEVAGPTPKTIVQDYENQTFEYAGALNGVTYVDGNITRLGGISKGAQDTRFADGDVFQGRYIVSNPNISSKGKLTITDDLLQYYDGSNASLRGAVPKTLKLGELSPNGQHALGLVAKDTYLKPAPNNVLDLYAVILSGHSIRDTEDENGIPQVTGGFGSDPSIMGGGYGMNSFNLYGGLVQANQRLWFQNGNGLTGNLKYDPAVAGDLPRFPRSNKVMTLRYADRYVDNTDAL